MNKYYFDVSDILEFARVHATLSGIPRVSLRIIGRLVEKHGPEQIRLIAFHPAQKRVVEIDSSFLTSSYSYDQTTFCAHCGIYQHSITLKEYLKKTYKNRLQRRWHKLRFKALELASKREILSEIAAPKNGLKEISLGSGDTVIIMGAAWNLNRYLDYLQHKKNEQGLRIVQFVHDLIPLVATEHVIDDVPGQFSSWLRKMADFTDVFLVNSNNTKIDLEWFLEKIGRHESVIKVIPLAHEFISEAVPEKFRDETPVLKNESQYPNGLKVRAQVLNAARLPYVLCAGTIESRKNVWNMAHVWGSLLEKHGEKLPRLIFAGANGWSHSDFENYLSGNGHLGGYIVICERPRDNELEFLYRNCLFTVFPSYYEGWGLPVGESLWFGKACAASNASAIPEAGLDMVTYFDPHSRDAMRSVLESLLFEPSRLEALTQRISRARLRTWDNVASELFLALH